MRHLAGLAERGLDQVVEGAVPVVDRDRDLHLEVGGEEDQRRAEDRPAPPGMRRDAPARRRRRGRRRRRSRGRTRGRGRTRSARRRGRPPSPGPAKPRRSPRAAPPRYQPAMQMAAQRTDGPEEEARRDWGRRIRTRARPSLWGRSTRAAPAAPGRSGVPLLTANAGALQRRRARLHREVIRASERDAVVQEAVRRVAGGLDREAAGAHVLEIGGASPGRCRR